MTPAMRHFRDRCVQGGGIYMYVRSLISSGVASCVDVMAGFVGFALLDFHPWVATSVGAMLGGIVNCVVNYRYTFRARACNKQAVAVKYALVWMGSLLLNAAGTSLLYDWMTHAFEGATGERVEDICYALSRLLVSLMVSFVWNFLLQRYFVYRPTPFDAALIRYNKDKR
jgi:putative flippase GtrA